MNLLSLFDKGVELTDTAQRELVHKVDIVCIVNKLVAKVLDGHGESCTEQADLMVSIAQTNDLFQNRLEFGRKKFVCFVHDNHLCFS